jgi:hypothetical protein
VYKNIIITILLLLVGYLLVNFFILKKDLIPKQEEIILNQEEIILNQKQMIQSKDNDVKLKNKKISDQIIEISKLKKSTSKKSTSKLNIFKTELYFGDSLRDVQIKKLDDIKLSNNKNMSRYKLLNGFYHRIIGGNYPGGYIDFHQNNLLVLSARGVLVYDQDMSDVINLKQIKNNLNNFIGLKQFQQSSNFLIRDLYIHKNNIYISYTEEFKSDNCFNTSVLHGVMNYEFIYFNKLFSSNKCATTINNTGQSGGRITNFDSNHILLTVGDFRNRSLAQDKKSINGKILKININNSDYEIVSMGHRNPQGLYFDKENNFILATEHGPQGGDEINLIEVDRINKSELLNYGWPIVSAGEHYGGRSKENEKKYEKYPLYNSHSEYGFIEPLISFVPSIAISEITKIGKNKYVMSSMGQERDGDKSIYFFELSNEKKIINLEKIKVFERVRDLIFKDNKLYLFLENTPSIGIISLN